MISSDFLVIGGGIGGVSCVETLAFYCPEASITLITESSLIKAVVNLIPLAKGLHRFDVEEQNVKDFKNKSVTIIVDRLEKINTADKLVETAQNKTVAYKFLCLCTGGRPRIIQPDNPLILGIRDTESILEFDKRIKKAHKIALVGNGGIASEMAFELKNVAIEWIVKDDYLASTFLDPGAAQFLKKNIHNNEIRPENTIKRMRFSELKAAGSVERGAALGPDWHQLLDMTGSNRTVSDKIEIHYKCEVDRVIKTDNKLTIFLSNGKEIADVDFLVSATGVDPRLDFSVDRKFKLGTDGGILVDKLMRSNLPEIYAAGDCCSAGWEKSEHWFQMRLWTQARQMGMMAGRSMAMAHNKEELNEDLQQDFCFEFFGHVTKLFGFQVVLLGRFNGQGLGNKYEALVRVSPNLEYIKLILVDGRLKGAILIGETGLEETFENLLLNQLDLTPFGDEILNPDIDIEDYFD